MHDLFSSFDTGTQRDMAVLDFSKAFDTVPHSKFLTKLSHYGIGGTILEWLNKFLTGRTMKVVLDGKMSREIPVDSGVPQGTVLGPLLFLCHINDLPTSVKSQVRLFADDCLLYRKIQTSNDHILLQKDLTQLGKWANTWGMNCNRERAKSTKVVDQTSRSSQLDTDTICSRLGLYAKIILTVSVSSQLFTNQFLNIWLITIIIYIYIYLRMGIYNVQLKNQFIVSFLGSAFMSMIRLRLKSRTISSSIHSIQQPLKSLL